MLFSYSALSIPYLKDIKVVDGDTVKAFYKDEMIKIRLAEIDAPETRQDFGYQSKKCLKQIIDDANDVIAFKFKEEDR
jgi:endonuclease YncB( thermonuclease family)